MPLWWCTRCLSRTRSVEHIFNTASLLSMNQSPVALISHLHRKHRRWWRRHVCENQRRDENWFFHLFSVPSFLAFFFLPFAHIGPRYRRPKVKKDKDDEKRPRTAFSNEQLNRLKVSEFVRKWDDNDKSKHTEVNEKYFRELISSINFLLFLSIIQKEFNENRYLTEKRRQHLSAELGLNEAQIKIW